MGAIGRNGRVCRTGPDLTENLSGGVGLVRWCRIGMWDETWDCGNHLRDELSSRSRTVAESPAKVAFDCATTFEMNSSFNRSSPRRR